MCACNVSSIINLPKWNIYWAYLITRLVLSISLLHFLLLFLLLGILSSPLRLRSRISTFDISSLCSFSVPLRASHSLSITILQSPLVSHTLCPSLSHYFFLSLYYHLHVFASLSYSLLLFLMYLFTIRYFLALQALKRFFHSVLCLPWNRPPLTPCFLTFAPRRRKE